VIKIVGIGADGWEGLGSAARAAVTTADQIVGSERQLALVPNGRAKKRPLPSPLEPLLEELSNGLEESVCVLASGDPMLHGIGATLARRVGPARLEVHPHPSALALACARLCWPEAEVELVNAVAGPLDMIAPLLQPGRKVVVYVAGADGAARAATALTSRGFGPSRFVVLEQLGAPGERITGSTADRWGGRLADPLHAVAIECRAEPDALVLGRHPGLADQAYQTDGQLTKWPVRAVTLAALLPGPGQLLWDVGAGSGSVAIEWLRAEPTARAIAVERRSDRAARIGKNAERLGVPQLEIINGDAPAVLENLERPQAAFVGGGVSQSGLLDACAQAAERTVAHAVTLEGERALQDARRRYGGTITRIAISHVEPLGELEAWRPQRPVVQWSTT
jgi:precorrin-6Y C5,15-methyltransferase (decarboxylating)